MARLQMANAGIQKVQAVVPPIEGTKPDGQIVVDIMNRMGYRRQIMIPK
ncbi:MAG: hypothetical protein IPP29_09960 [Bacteroidetes bacterium]|nr:hypothetical protein [Bacteroidota bacterium]